MRADLAAQIRALALEGRLGEARRALESCRDGAGQADPLTWAQLAEEIGEPTLALEHLARHADRSPALALERDLLRQALAPPTSGPGAAEGDTRDLPKRAGSTPGMGATEDRDGDPVGVAGGRADRRLDDSIAAHQFAPNTAGLVRFQSLFEGRAGVYARQWIDAKGKTGWGPVRAPLTLAVLGDHLNGELTAGVYPVRVDNTVTFFTLDVDVPRGVLKAAKTRAAQDALRHLLHTEGLRLREALIQAGLPVILADSGQKGRHLYGFLADPLPARLVLSVISGLMRQLQLAAPLQVDLFPRQAQVKPGGLGNLIKLPLGIHLGSGRRAVLLDELGQPDPDPWARLLAVHRMTREELLAGFRARQATPTAAGGTRGRDRSVGGKATDAPSATVAGHSGRAAIDPADGAPLSIRAADTIEALLCRCRVLEALADKARREHVLRHPERLVLRHCFGHLPGGPTWLNALFDRCPSVPARERLKAPLRGFPMSCGTIRRRVPELTGRLPCRCDFEGADDDYPHPLRHLRAPPATPSPAAMRLPPAETVAPAESGAPLAGRRLADELREAKARVHALEAALSTVLRALPNGRLVLPEGVWRLAGASEDDQAIGFEPRAGIDLTTSEREP